MRTWAVSKETAAAANSTSSAALSFLGNPHVRPVCKLRFPRDSGLASDALLAALRN